MSRLYNVAVVGATGAVGETMLEVLAERNFPVGELYALASARSVGKMVTCGDRRLRVQDLATFDFSKAQIGLFSAGGSVSAEYAPRAAEAGCVVIDNTSHFRNEDDIPLVVPEVNPGDIADYRNRGIIANPNCSTIQMVVALKPSHDAAPHCGNHLPVRFRHGDGSSGRTDRPEPSGVERAGRGAACLSPPDSIQRAA